MEALGKKDEYENGDIQVKHKEMFVGRKVY